MFDIGFWEIAVIAVIALIVVGPEEFPTLVRNIGGWLGKLRRFMSETREELDREFSKAEELKKLIEQETAIAELHRQIDPRQIDPGQIDPGQTKTSRPAAGSPDSPLQTTAGAGVEQAGEAVSEQNKTDAVVGAVSQSHHDVAPQQPPGKDATS